MSDEQSDPNLLRLQSVDAATLTPMVQKLLNSDTLQVSEWEYKQIHGGSGGGRGGTAIYRFSGLAIDADKRVPWSLILKIVRARAGEVPTSTHYWKREAEAYRSGIFDNLSGRFSAARSIGVQEHPEESCWIWQEGIEDAVGKQWQWEHFRITARHLGTFNGAYLEERPLPEYDWLSRNWLRQIVAEAESNLPSILDMLGSPHVSPLLNPDTVERFQRYWGERVRFLDALDRLPQTLCHQDPVRANLFLRQRTDGELDTVAIDWAFVGIAAIGVDIAVPQNINLFFFWFEPSQPRALDEALFTGYLQGLREVCSTVDERLVRLGFCAAVVCKFAEGMMLNARFGLGNLEYAAQFEGALGRPYMEIVGAFAHVFNYVVEIADEARALMDELGY